LQRNKQTKRGSASERYIYGGMERAGVWGYEVRARKTYYIIQAIKAFIY
jgi:hypothetical protein